MGKLIDYSNQVIGNCKVFERVGTHKNKDALWSCQCLVCGSLFEAPSREVKRGVSCSSQCGVSQSNRNRTQHGEYKHSDYLRWRGIKHRCFNPNAFAYHRYGGRGITMYSEWVNDYPAFAAYIRTLPDYGKVDVTLDRIDNDGNYEPENLRWVTRKEQSLNRENNVYVDICGIQKTLSEWAEYSQLGRTLIDRYYDGWRGESLLKPKLTS